MPHPEPLVPPFLLAIVDPAVRRAAAAGRWPELRPSADAVTANPRAITRVPAGAVTAVLLMCDPATAALAAAADPRRATVAAYEQVSHAPTPQVTEQGLCVHGRTVSIAPALATLDAATRRQLAESATQILTLDAGLRPDASVYALWDTVLADVAHPVSWLGELAYHRPELPAGLAPLTAERLWNLRRLGSVPIAALRTLVGQLRLTDAAVASLVTRTIPAPGGRPVAPIILLLCDAHVPVDQPLAHHPESPGVGVRFEVLLELAGTLVHPSLAAYVQAQLHTQTEADALFDDALLDVARRYFTEVELGERTEGHAFRVWVQQASPTVRRAWLATTTPARAFAALRYLHGDAREAVLDALPETVPGLLAALLDGRPVRGDIAHALTGWLTAACGTDTGLWEQVWRRGVTWPGTMRALVDTCRAARATR